MPTYTGKDLNLTKPLMSDNISDSIPALAANMQKIDDAVTVNNASLTDKTNILNFPVTNIITKGNFPDVTGWAAVSGTIAAAANELTYTVSAADIYARILQNKTLAVGKLYVAYDIYPKYANETVFYTSLTTSNAVNVNPPANVWTRISNIFDNTVAGATDLYFIHRTNTSYVVGDTVKFRNVLVIDLTAAFGAGKEPSQIEMDYLMTYYANNWFDGTVNPFRPLKDIGVRAFNADFPAKNIITNGKFANGTTGWLGGLANISAANNELTSIATAQYGGPSQSFTTSSYNSHKLYFAANVKVDAANVTLDFNDGLDQTMLYPTILNAYQRLSSIWTVNAAATSLFIKLQDNRASGWTNTYMKNVIIIDLTATFGAGNEPTAAEMDRMLAKFPNSWFDGTVNPLLSSPELLVYLNKNKANIAQEDWIIPTLLNAWVNKAVYYSCAYRKSTLKRVELRGVVMSGIMSAAICNLPAGYRPIKYILVPVASNSGIGILQITPTGDLIPVVGGNTDYFSLDGITFDVD